MMPPMWDVVRKNRIRVGTAVTQGQGWIASRNLIGHVAKVGRGRRVAGRVKAGSRKSRRSKSHKRDGGRERDKHEPRKPGVWSSQHEREMPDQSPSRTAQKDMQDAGHSAFSNDLSKFWKLKDEVVKNAQSYIRRRATVIFRTLSPNHEAVKCLSAFSDQAQKFAAEVLAIIEWGHPTLEAPRDLPGACDPQMAPNT